MIKRVAFLLLIVTVVAGCDKNRVFEKNRDIKDYTWDSKNKASFTFDIQDTTLLYNIYVNIRHTDFYQFSNIWLMVRTTFPDGKQMTKRIEIPLANAEGAWFGEGLGDIWDVSHLIQQGAFFSKAGKYTFE